MQILRGLQDVYIYTERRWEEGRDRPAEVALFDILACALEIVTGIPAGSKMRGSTKSSLSL